MAATQNDPRCIEERRRLRKRLHDGLSQSLFAAAGLAEMLPMLLEKDPVHAKQIITDLAGLTREAVDELRQVMTELSDE